MLSDIYPYFVGAYGENDEFLEKILVDFLRDHIHWRRNFHPKDRWLIPTRAQYSDDFLGFIAELKHELHKLSVDLKNSTPFFSPRYIGHMASDLLMPGLLAQLITTLYNPNNVSLDAAPATVPLELEVGRQLCEMIGYNIDQDNQEQPCAWGHLTSGGTIANYEGLLACRAIKLYPLAIHAAALNDFKELRLAYNNRALAGYDKWELLNLSVDQVVHLVRDVKDLIITTRGQTATKDFFDVAKRYRSEHLGLQSFLNSQEITEPPVIIAPTTVHYSFDKAVRLLGLGTTNLVKIEVDRNFKMDITKLKMQLEECCSKKRAVFAVIGVLGTTEFGTVDPIHEIVKVRNSFRQKGLDFYIHIDGAWGGYLSTLVRTEGRMSKAKKAMLSPEVSKAFKAVRNADSVTIDPHKLGYLPFGSGAFIARNRELIRLVQQDAPYVWGEGAR